MVDHGGVNGAQTLSVAKTFALSGAGEGAGTPFTGSVNYQTTNETRFVRFHVRAKDEFIGAPYFYMYYKQISPDTDEENRHRWRLGDSVDYFNYINEKTTFSNTEQMAYYGSTQCNYYDAPIVNVLNTLVSGSPSPYQKWAFSTYPYDDWCIGGSSSYRVPSFLRSNAMTVSYQGEIYYAVPCSLSDSSFLIVQNRKGYASTLNNATMTGYMFEGDMSLKQNSGIWQTVISENYYYTKEHLDSNGNRIKTATYDQFNSSGNLVALGVGRYLYHYDRAGGAIVSDETYSDGSPAGYNYGGYTPSWYTFRIPAQSEVTIKSITGVVGSYTSIVGNNTAAFKAVKESQNVNSAVYIYKPASGYVQTFSYDPDRGVVDALPGSDNATVSVFFDNIESWSSVYVHAYSPLVRRNTGSCQRIQRHGTLTARTTTCSRLKRASIRSSSFMRRLIRT